MLISIVISIVINYQLEIIITYVIINAIIITIMIIFPVIFSIINFDTAVIFYHHHYYLRHEVVFGSVGSILGSLVSRKTQNVRTVKNFLPEACLSPAWMPLDF